MSMNQALAAPAGARRRDAVTWYAYLLLGAFTYLVSMQGNILPFLRADLGLTYGMVSLHASALAAGMLVVGLFGERITRRLGRGAALGLGVVGAAAGAVLLCLAPAAWASLASCVVLGLFSAFIPSTVSALLSDIHRDQREVAMSEANAMAYAFAVSVPLIAGLLVAAGWNWRLIPLAGALAGATIMLTFLNTRVPDASCADAAADARTTLPPAFWFYWLALGFGVAVEFSVLLWAPAYLEKVIGLTTASAATGAIAFFIAMLAGRIVGSLLVRVVDDRLLFVAVAAVTLIGFAIYTATQDPVVSVAGLFVLGLGIALLFPLTMSFALAAAAPASDHAGARLVLAPALAVVLSPPLLGALADAAGLGVAVTMTPVLMVAAVAAFLVANRLARPARKVSPSAA
jgi:fucose permease